MEIINVSYTRKPETFETVRPDKNDTDETVVAYTYSLTKEEYDNFTYDFLNDYPWLSGRGGAIKYREENNRWIIQAVKVIAPDRQPLFVNPEGYSYARYVGVAM